MMVRSMTLAAVLGAFVAAGAAFAVNQPAWQNLLAAWFGAPERRVPTHLPAQPGDRGAHGRRAHVPRDRDERRGGARLRE